MEDWASVKTLPKGKNVLFAALPKEKSIYYCDNQQWELFIGRLTGKYMKGTEGFWSLDDFYIKWRPLPDLPKGTS